MTDRRTRRSAAPEDPSAFAPGELQALRTAVAHLSLLEALGYTGSAPLSLVGNRFQLTTRQRHAVRRCACSPRQAKQRADKQVPFEALAGRTLLIDGFNLLITLETALGGGVVLKARDGCLRDLAHLRGTWRRVLETPDALALLGRTLDAARVARAHVLVDARVSNSGRLVTLLRDVSEAWSTELSCEAAEGVDGRLQTSGDVVASADSVVLDACQAWTNLAQHALDVGAVDAWLVDLSDAALPEIAGSVQGAW